MTTAKDTQWFLVVDDPFTNEVIAAELARINAADGNETTFTDNEGKERNGWRVSFQILDRFLKAAKSDKRLKLKPFVKEGGGAPREWTLPKAKKASAKVKDATRQLREIQSRKK